MNAVKFVLGILGSVLTVLMVIVILGAIMSTDLAPSPGDLLYPAWTRNINMISDVLPMMVMGVGAIAAYLIAQMRSGF